MSGPSFRQISIRVKLALLASAVIVLVVVGQTIMSLAGEAVAVQEAVALRARLITMSLAAALGPLWTETSVPALGPFAERIGRDLQVRSLALIDPDGRVIVAHGMAPSADDIRRVTHLRLRLEPLPVWGLVWSPADFVVASPLLRGSEVRGYLLCAFRSDEPASKLRGLVASALVGTLFWVGIGAGLTLWVTRRLTAPLVRLAADLGGLGREAYTMPLEGRADGEIGLVQERLEGLSTRLEDERRRVSELTEALRHQVEEVSADLERVARQRQAILDSVRDGILLVERSGAVSVANDPARVLFGGDLTGAPLASRVIERERLEDAIRQALARAAPVMVQAHTLAPDGAEAKRQLRLRVSALGSDAADAAAVVVVAEDVTESRLLEEQMWRSERLAALGTLTAGLAHQIGNQLSAIKGYADLAARRAGDTLPDLCADLDVIRREVRNAAALMDRVLLLARTRPPSHARLHVPTLLKEALEVVRPEARQKGVEVVVEFPESGCVTTGDPYLFQQAVLNLYVNAIQAMAGGGRLSVSSSCTGGRVCVIRVADTGPGIPEDLRQRVFDPFFTTKPEGQGTGLGLAITHRILELHDASIRIESELGKGTSFIIDLPLRAVEPELVIPARRTA